MNDEVLKRTLQLREEIQARLDELFKLISCGVYVIGVTNGTQYNAFTAAWVVQVSFQPLLLALGINPHHRSYAMLKAGESFTVNVLGREQLELAHHFAAPLADKLARVETLGPNLESNGLELCQVEEVVDLAQKLLGVGLDPPQRLYLLLAA